jgi:AMP-binding enzyme
MPQVPLADSDAYNIGYDVCDRHAGDPSRRALIYEDAAGQIQEYTFLEIMRRANRLANALTAQGLARGDRIGIVLPSLTSRTTRWAGSRCPCLPCSAQKRSSTDWCPGGCPRQSRCRRLRPGGWRRSRGQVA